MPADVWYLGYDFLEGARTPKFQGCRDTTHKLRFPRILNGFEPNVWDFIPTNPGAKHEARRLFNSASNAMKNSPFISRHEFEKVVCDWVWRWLAGVGLYGISTLPYIALFSLHPNPPKSPSSAKKTQREQKKTRSNSPVHHTWRFCIVVFGFPISAPGRKGTSQSVFKGTQWGGYLNLATSKISTWSVSAWYPTVFFGLDKDRSGRSFF